MNDSYEGEIGALLAELADVQSALLGVLGEKRTLLVAGDRRRADGDRVARAGACRSTASMSRASAAAASASGCRRVAG